MCLVMGRKHGKIRSEHLGGTKMNAIDHLEKLLNINIEQPELIQMAFLHQSYVNEHPRMNLVSNERLEFLGDAVLEIVTSDFLYHAYPKEDEGILSRYRAILVQEQTLSTLAIECHFDRHLKMGKGEEKMGGRKRPSNLSNCFEAVLGALYLDQGLALVTQFLNQVLLDRHDRFINDQPVDYKTLLQEKLQAGGAIDIAYQILEETGPAHAKTFKVGLLVNDKIIAEGSGRTRKKAEMQAAQTALNNMETVS